MVHPGAKTNALAATILLYARYIRLAWIEARPIVQFIFLLRFLTAATIVAAYTGTLPLRSVLVGAGAWLCATWCIYLLNGLCDQVEDRGNHSTRPVATGALPGDAGRRITAGLALAALLLAVLATRWMVMYVLVMLLLGWSYSAGQRPQKATPIGFVVVVSAGGIVTYLAGSLAAGGGLSHELIVLMCAMSLWMALAGSTKDLSDTDGDRAAGRRTLPVILGDHLARRVMAVMAVGVGILMFAWAQAFAAILVPSAALLIIGASAVAVTLVVSTGTTDRNLQRQPYRLFMLTQWSVHGSIVLGHIVAS